MRSAQQQLGAEVLRESNGQIRAESEDEAGHSGDSSGSCDEVASNIYFHGQASTAVETEMVVN
jgi:hypothetical protein